MVVTKKPRKLRRHQPPLSPKILAKRVAQEERDDKAWRLFMSGQDMTKSAIARALGYSDASHVKKALDRVRERMRMSSAEIKDLVIREWARLDLVASSIFPEASNGLPEMNKDGTPTDYTALTRLHAKIAAGDALQRRSESLRLLLGLNAATRLIATGENGAPLGSSSLEDIERAREAAMTEAREAAARNLE